jgi:hypothetical protein
LQRHGTVPEADEIVRTLADETANALKIGARLVSTA